MTTTTTKNKFSKRQMRKNMERKSAKTKNFLQNSQGKKATFFDFETQAKRVRVIKITTFKKKVITKKKYISNVLINLHSIIFVVDGDID